MNTSVKVLLLLFLFVANGCTSNKINSDLELFGLKGKVKTVTYSYYKAIERFGEVEQGERIDGSVNDGIVNKNSVYYSLEEDSDFKCWMRTQVWTTGSRHKTNCIFDNHGNLTEILHYDTSGILKNKTLIVYDNSGRLKEENNYTKSYYEPEVALNRKYIYQIGDHGKIIESKEYHSEGSLSEKITYAYDNNKNLISKKKVDSELGLYDSTNLLYNNGKLAEKKHWFYYVNSTSYIDQNGEQVIVSTEEENINKRELYKLDNVGNIIEKTRFKNNGKIDFKGVIKENNKDKTFEILKYNSDDKLASKVILTFDNKGNIIKQHEYIYHSYHPSLEWVDENVTEYKYQYDSKGNWIQRISFIGEKPNIIVQREIVYF